MKKDDKHDTQDDQEVEIVRNRKRKLRDYV